jgi:hypothetical protein
VFAGRRSSVRYPESRTASPLKRRSRSKAARLTRRSPRCDLCKCHQGRGELTLGQITTNGSNLAGIWDFVGKSETSLIDLDELYSNDIYALLHAYGVEMARAAILREVNGVFKAYSIDVDMRHLELIADYMVSGDVLLHGMRAHLISLPDFRRRIQAVQPKGPLNQLVTFAKGFIRNHSSLSLGCDFIW